MAAPPAVAFEKPTSLAVAIADNFSPYSFVSDGGDPRGYVKDLWDLWARRTGVAVRILPMEWPRELDELRAGRVDVLGAVPKGPEDDAMDYSAEPLAAVDHLAFYDQDIADVIDADSLQRYTVGVVSGGNCHRWLLHNRVFGVRAYPGFSALLDGFQRGEVHVFCGGRANGLQELRRRGLDGGVKVSPPLFSGGLHWATRGSDAELYRFIAEGFASISRQERDEIAANWRAGVWRTATAEQIFSRLTYLLLGAVAAVVVVFTWAVILRRRLARMGRHLRDTETRFAAVLDTLGEAVWIKDLNGRYLVASGAMASACGQPGPAAMIGRTDADYFPREVAERHRHADAMVLERRAPTITVESFPQADGSMKWIEKTKAPLRDADGRALGIVCVSRDVSARRLAEEALVQVTGALQVTEGRYRDVLATLPVGLFEVDVHGNIVFANERIWAISGISPEKWSARPWASFIHADDRVGVVAAIRRMMTRGERLDVEFRIANDASTPVWVRALGFRRNETAGGLISVLDISDQRNGEESRISRNAQFRALTELSPDCIVRYDLEGRRLYANPSFVAAAGYPLAELLGKTPSETMSGPQMKAFEAKIRAVAEVGCMTVHELRWPDRDGTIRTSDVRMLPERDDTGKVVSVIAVGRDVTSLKTVEEELVRKSEKLAAILDHLPGNAFTVRYTADGERRAEYSSFEGHLAFYGMSDAECRAHVHPDDHRLVFTEVLEGLRQRGYSEAKFRALRADGSVAWLHSRERVREWQGGDMIVDGLIFDVTDEMEARQQLEHTAEELRNTAQRMCTLLDNIPGVTYRKEYLPDDSRLVYTNAGVQRLLAPATAHRTLAERMATIWHPDDHDALRAFDRAMRSGQDHGDIKVRFFHLDGTVHWGLIREKVIERRDGVIIAEGLMIDITEEMQAKMTLEENVEELWRMAGSLRTLLNNLPGVVYRMEYMPNGEKRILEYYGEPLCCDGDGHTAEGFRELIYPEDIGLVYTDLPSRLRSQGRGEQTFRMVRGDGSVRWVHAREKVVEQMGNGLIVEGQAYDITAEVAMRQDLEESERRRQRAETRLQQGRRFEVLGQFAGGIAHDFNNLLGAMLGYARFIEEDTPPESDSHRHASRIIAAGNKGRAIVDQILNYSRRMELAVSRFTIGDLISDVVTSCAADCPPGTVFDVDRSLDGLELQADRVQLARVLMNLCVNARDALGEAPGRVTLGAHQHELDAGVLRRLAERADDEDAGDVEAWTDAAGYAWVVAGRLPKTEPYLVFTVTDSGCGMDANLLEQAFAPFFTTKDRSRGAGLGLSVVHGVVIAHGGALIARSRPGQGTRFEVVLPIERQQAEPVAVQPPAEEPAELRVLLVEDNVDVLDAVCEALKRVDYAVDAFADPLAALEAFRATPHRWGVVVTDQIMPKLRGIDLIRTLHEVRPEVPCLLCSGYAEELSSAVCQSAGVSEMLRKPVGLGDLLRAIDRVVAGAASAA